MQGQPPTLATPHLKQPDWTSGRLDAWTFGRPEVSVALMLGTFLVGGELRIAVMTRAQLGRKVR